MQYCSYSTTSQTEFISHDQPRCIIYNIDIRYRNRLSTLSCPSERIQASEWALLMPSEWALLMPVGRLGGGGAGFGPVLGDLAGEGFGAVFSLHMHTFSSPSGQKPGVGVGSHLMLLPCLPGNLLLLPCLPGNLLIVPILPPLPPLPVVGVSSSKHS
jgi:hypothetical protein